MSSALSRVGVQQPQHLCKAVQLAGRGSEDGGGVGLSAELEHPPGLGLHLRQLREQRPLRATPAASARPHGFCMGGVGPSEIQTERAAADARRHAYGGERKRC